VWCPRTLRCVRRDIATAFKDFEHEGSGLVSLSCSSEGNSFTTSRRILLQSESAYWRIGHWRIRIGAWRIGALAYWEGSVVFLCGAVRRGQSTHCCVVNNCSLGEWKLCFSVRGRPFLGPRGGKELFAVVAVTSRFGLVVWAIRVLRDDPVLKCKLRGRSFLRGRLCKDLGVLPERGFPRRITGPGINSGSSLSRELSVYEGCSLALVCIKDPTS